ncbi:MAG TPA: cyclodeaminase/cyclohydrolase family protein, partial [Gammaproteobacteria bacterium]|nr:cyclodeaminase/cyclohydrolase family protein [Gammaproteobacteria bacterium]
MDEECAGVRRSGGDDMEDRSMADHSMEDRAEAARRALIDAALAAYEDAGLSGLCAEGRWEAAVDALRSLDLTHVARPRVDQPLSSPPPPTADLIAGLSAAIAAVSGNSAPPPGGGSVAASVGALAAALTRMVAGLTHGRAKYAHVADEMRMVADRASTLAGELTALVARDASVFDALTAAYRRPRATPDAASARAAAIERALLPAAEAPLEIARA